MEATVRSTQRNYLLILWIVVCSLACKKDKVIPENVEEIVSPTTGTRTQFTLDSIYLYAKQVYLWNDVLPAYATFNPRAKYAAYTPELTAFNKELFDITQLKVNPLTTLPYEHPLYAGKAKYSYLESGRAGGTTVTARGFAADAGNDPVLNIASLNVGTAKVGYIALSSFPKLATAQGYLDAAFSQLSASSPTDFVIDLRGNGGGYVETAEYVANLVAPSTLNGKIMYVEQFNLQMQQGKALILRHQPYLDENSKPVQHKGRNATMADIDFTEAANTYKFSKKGNLETVKNLYFIVSGSTASASELLINCLRPYFNVRLAGTKTYGKPVGFFGLAIDQYTVYMSSFLIKNASGSSDYFNGMAVDIDVESNDKYSLGDPNESCLSKVLDDVHKREAPSAKLFPTNMNVKSVMVPVISPPLSANKAKFIGMIENRRRIKR